MEPVKSPENISKIPKSPTKPSNSILLGENLTNLCPGVSSVTQTDKNESTVADLGVLGAVATMPAGFFEDGEIDWSKTYPFMAPKDRYPGGWKAFQWTFRNKRKTDNIWANFEKEKKKAQARKPARKLAKFVRELDDYTDDKRDFDYGIANPSPKTP